MKKFVFIFFVFGFSIKMYSQTIENIPKDNFLNGAWYDSSYAELEGGFIFSPDSCCSFIINGEPTECIIENQNLKVHYQVNYQTTPKQLDILLIDLKTDSIKGIIPMIFEIIDINHIKLATYKTVSKIRPMDFNKREDTEVTTLTRYVKTEN